MLQSEFRENRSTGSGEEDFTSVGEERANLSAVVYL